MVSYGLDSASAQPHARNCCRQTPVFINMISFHYRRRTNVSTYPESKEQVLVGRVNSGDRAIGQHQLVGECIVDRETVLVAQPRIS